MHEGFCIQKNAESPESNMKPQTFLCQQRGSTSHVAQTGTTASRSGTVADVPVSFVTQYLQCLSFGRVQ